VFAAYANQNFDYHISRCTEISKGMMDQLDKLFQQKSTYLAAILQIKILRGGHDYGIIRQYFDRMAFPVSPSTVIYSSSLYNITDIRKQWIDQTTPKYVLHFAAAAGLTSGITRLVDEDCAIDEKDGSSKTPLHHACLNAGLHIVKLLLKKGADVNAQGGYYGNAFYAASYRGNEAIVKLLVEKGADVNAQGGEYGNALQAASEGGHEAIVKLLVEKGADVNEQGGYFGNALQAASYRGNEAIVKLLVEKGADVNAQGGSYGNALQAASSGGNEAIVKLLVEKGASSHTQELAP
jgi:ankyrin repeat protein